MKLNILTVIFMLIMSSLKVSGAQQIPSDSVAFNPAVRHGKLANGFQYYILNEERSDKKVSFRLIVKAGFSNENVDQAGIAHLVEHIGMRSSKNFPGGTRDFLLNNGVPRESVGASTSPNYTEFHFKIDSHNRNLLKSGVEIIYDIATGLTFLPTEVDEERSAVIREISNAQTKSFFAFSEIKDQLLGNKVKYPIRSAKEMQNIQNIPIEAIINFHKDWYFPANQAIIIVGDVNVVEIENFIKKSFSGLENGGIQEGGLKNNRFNTHLSGENTVIFVEPGNSTIQIQLYKMRKSVLAKQSPATLRDFRIVVMDDLINLMIRNRLKTTTRNEQVAYQEIRQSIGREIIGNSGLDGIQTETSVGSAAEVKPVLTFMVKELRRLKDFGFSQSEYDRAILGYRNSPGYLQSSETLLFNNYMTGAAVPANEAQLKVDLLKGIELPEINNMLSDFLSRNENMSVVLSIPDGMKSQLPDRNLILEWLDEAWNSKGAPFVQDIVKGPVLPIVKYNSQTKFVVNELPVLNATEVVLTNGIKVILKTLPEDRKNGFDIMLRGFKSFVPSSHEQRVIPVLKGVSNYMGLGSLNHAELSVWNEYQNESGTILSASPYIKSGESGIVGTSMNANAEVLLQLVTAYFKSASVDQDAFLQNLNAVKASALKKSKSSLLEDSIQVIMNTSNRKKYPIDAFHSLTAGEIFHIYKDHFTYANGYSFVITGSFDKELMIKLVASYFSSLPASDSHSSTQTEKDVKRKKVNKPNRNPKAMKSVLVGDSIGNVDVRMLFKGQKASSVIDRLKLEILRQIIGRILNIRLREKEKGVYFVRAEIPFTDNIDGYYLDVEFQTAPVDVDRLVASVTDELNKLSNGELADSIYQNAMRVVRMRVSRDINSPFWWDKYLTEQIRLGSYSEDGLRRLALLNSITLKEVTQAMHRFFNLDEYALFEVL